MSLPPPIQPLRCDHPDCTLPQGGRCARAAEFADPLELCPNLARTDEPAIPIQASITPAARIESPIPEDAAPWKGRHLNLTEAAQILQRSPARVISVMGPYGAGKTCLLASFFLQIANGQRGALPYRFASSRTLYGFRALVDRANLWSGSEHDEIVGHTPKEETEASGQFLHLGLRPADSKDDRHIDVLLSDVPGEWFTEWTVHADERTSIRLQFIHRSDGFIVVVDAAALLGPPGPARKMDADVGLLIRRLVSDIKPQQAPRALALVFSKVDRVLDRFKPPDRSDAGRREAWGILSQRAGKIFTALDLAREKAIDVTALPVSSFPRPLSDGQPVGVIAPFAHIMGVVDRRERWPRLLPVVPEGAKGFAAMRRWEGSP